MVTDANELSTLEEAHGEAPESEFDDAVDTLETEEFQEVEEDEQPETDKSQKASDEPETEKPQWDQERQRADQAEANYRKAQGELESTKSQLETQGEAIKSMQEKLDKYATSQKVDLDALDEDIVDPSVKNALKSMQAEVDAAKAEVEALKQSKNQIAKDLAKQAGDNAREAEKTEIVAAIEEDYPAKFRNAAIKAANEICTKRGYAPKSATESQSILRSCYRELADKAKPTSKKTSVATDSGEKATPVVAEDNKQTTLKERSNYWRKKLKKG